MDSAVMHNKKCTESRLGSYHVHSWYSDGENTPEELVKAAISCNFTDLGFTDHAILPYAMDWHIPPRNYVQYFRQVRSLAHQMQVAGIPLHIYAGLEADYMPLLSDPSFLQYTQFLPDYIIGSVHYISPLDRLPAGAKLVCADCTAEEITEGIKTIFDGSAERLVRTYWQNVRNMVNTSPIAIVGHLDLIKKENGKLGMFSEDDGWYREEVEKTVETIMRKNIIVEINTGGIARSGLTDVYPSAWILKLLYQAGVGITISSDCHRATDLATGYDYAYKVAESASYCSLMHLDDDNGRLEWNPYPLRDV